MYHALIFVQQAGASGLSERDLFLYKVKQVGVHVGKVLQDLQRTLINESAAATRDLQHNVQVRENKKGTGTGTGSFICNCMLTEHRWSREADSVYFLRNAEI